MSVGKLNPQAIYEDTFANLWNDIEPATIYYPFTDTLPGFLMVIIFTIAHVALNAIFDGSAKRFAAKNVNLDEYKKIDWIQQRSNAIAKLKKIKDKTEMKSEATKLGLSSEQLKELKAMIKAERDFTKYVSKFKEAIFKVIVFGFVYLWGVYILCVEGSFFWHQKTIWNVHPQIVTPNLSFYYALQMGYHGHRAIFQFFEHRRSDFWPMFVHHWATWFLLTQSWMLGFMQSGATVLLLNDNTDLFLPLCKLCEYVGFDFGYNLFKMLFLVCFIPLRCFVYFYKVLWSTMVEGYPIIRKQKQNWIGVFLLFVIYLLQWYWGYLIAKVIKKALCERVKVRDTRSDADNDSDGDVKKEKHN